MSLTRPSLLLLGSFTVLTIVGCHDEERAPTHAAHPSHGAPAEPVAQPATPHKTDTQAKVAGAPDQEATPAPAGQPAGATPAKTTETNKVTGAPNDTATPAPQPEPSVPPEKSPIGGKDATR